MAEKFDRKELEAWLKGQPREVSIAIAARAALRVLPVLVLDTGYKGRYASSPVRIAGLHIFRAVALSLAAAKYPNIGVVYPVSRAVVGDADTTADLYVSGERASSRLASAKDDGDGSRLAADPDYRASRLMYAAAGAVAEAASNAARVVGISSKQVAEVAARAILFADRAMPTADRFDVLAALSADRTFIVGGGSASQLARQKLWLGGDQHLIQPMWDSFKQDLRKYDVHWEVWTRWYEALLDGKPTPGGEVLDIFRVTLDSEEDWAKSPRQINALIKAKEDEIAGREPSPDQVDIPAIPTQKPAAIQPVIREGRIVLPADHAIGDSGAEIERAALASARSGLENILRSTQDVANIDGRFRDYLDGALSRFPQSGATQEQIFEIGHVHAVLRGYGSTVNTEWPEFIAADYHATILQLDRTLRQYPMWREFLRNAEKKTFTAVQRTELVTEATRIAGYLSTREVAELLDAAIPDALRRLLVPELAQVANRIEQEAVDLVSQDILESISNIYNPVAAIALQYWSDFKDGAKSEVLKSAKEDGRKLVKWGKRVLIGASACGVGTLIVAYPHTLGWLGQVIEFVKAAAG